MKLKNLTVIALTGMVCMTACTSQPAVEGKWVGGAGKTVYLQQKADDQTRVVDSAVVAADGSFAFALPAGKIDVYELSAANEARKNLLLSDVPVVVTIETETETNEDSTTVDVLNILAEGDQPGCVRVDGRARSLFERKERVGRHGAHSFRCARTKSSSLSEGYIRYTRSISSAWPGLSVSSGSRHQVPGIRP